MIEPKYQTLNALFSDRVFRIPEYQRFYSWLPKQREDLFGDIRELAKKGEDRHHFMATIVCFPDNFTTQNKSTVRILPSKYSLPNFTMLYPL